MSDEQRRAIIIACMASKGGSGKSTSTVNLAAAYARAGAKVCVVDLDQQRSSTDTLLPDASQARGSIFDLVQASQFTHESVTGLICDTPWSRDIQEIQMVQGAVHIIPGDTLCVADAFMGAHLLSLTRALEQIRSDYDIILIDCPPSTDRVAQAALHATDEVLLLTEPAFMSMASLNRFLTYFIREYNEGAGADRPVHLAGVLVTRYDGRLAEHKENLKALRRAYPDLLLQVRILYRSVVEVANGSGLPVFVFGGTPARQVSDGYSRVALHVLGDRTGPRWEQLRAVLRSQIAAAARSVAHMVEPEEEQ